MDKLTCAVNGKIGMGINMVKLGSGLPVSGKLSSVLPVSGKNDKIRYRQSNV